MTTSDNFDQRASAMLNREISVLLLSLNYAPEQTGIAPYSTELAEGLASDGFQVRALTGYPHYPQWVPLRGYGGFVINEILNRVSVTRLRHYIPKKPNFLSRLHMELSFGVRTVLCRWGHPDAVLSVSPALFASGIAVSRARLQGVPVGIWIQDIYSRGLEETKGGSSVVSKFMKAFEGLILRSANEVVVIHERFRNYLVQELRVPEHKVRVIRNWSHVEVSNSIDRMSARRRLGWADDEVVALHAGNMGVKQDLGNVIEAARAAMSNGNKVRFVLLGDGNRRASLEIQAEGVTNLDFLAPLPEREFVSALQAADVLLVNELPGVREMSVPSKLTSYFATGQPIVAATEPDSATADEIISSGSGIHIISGNPSLLLETVESLAADPAARRKFGKAGVPYAQTVLSRDIALSKFSEWVTLVANTNS